MTKTLVIVESPTKAKTIRNYLPKGYVVMSSMGHIRDLPNNADEIPAKYKKEKWAQIGVNTTADFEPIYVIPKDKKKVVKELKEALADADELLLATDEDREGESISWHLLQVLNPKIPVKRMVFHEITREAIQEALNHTRDVDECLVRAQETRRILDRLVGYTLSPLLWKKIGGNLSAGRVQSVAVRLLVQRERERRAFKRGRYWDLKATLAKDDAAFEAVLVALDGKRIATGRDFDESTGKVKEGVDVLLLDEQGARTLLAKLAHVDAAALTKLDEVTLAPAAGAPAWRVVDVELKPQVRKPAPPFITSTLQQEANRKLNLSAQQTMRVAQDLYQRGFITYMRTDSTHLSQQAVEAARAWVSEMYGEEYLSPQPRQYVTSSKAAQEAHEAIRPAGNRFRSPQETGLSGIELKLYEMIWQRTVATQMADAQQTFITVHIEVDRARFRASGKRIDFPGYLRAYVEGSDDPDQALSDRELPLPPLEVGDVVDCRELAAIGHETQPPARYSEASLIQTLEQEGVGRPSTYASIIQTIQDRGYALLQQKRLVPTYRAFAVTQLLEKYFPHLVDLGFTAGMESVLDKIATGEADWLPYLREFYAGESGLEHQVEVREAEIEPEAARAIVLGDLDATVRIGRFGPYVERDDGGKKVRATIPDDVPPADLNEALVEALLGQKSEGPEPLGTDPVSGEQVYVLNGRFGPYVQLGMPEATDANSKSKTKVPKPKRVSLPKGMKPEDVTLELALGLLSLPRVLGSHPQGGRVEVGLGRFGPYVVHRGPDGKAEFRSLKAGDDVLTVDLERVLELLSEPKGARGSRSRSTAKSPLQELGPHPDDGAPVQVLDGRYGPYVKHKSVNVTLPKGTDPATVTLEQAVELLAAKAGKGGKTGRKR